MRNIIAIMLILILFSCEDEDDKKISLTTNTFSAEKNNADWSGVIEISGHTDTDTVLFFASANMPNTEVLVMKIKFEGPRTYLLENSQARYYSTVGGDVLTSEYVLAPNTSGVLEVVEYNKNKSTMKGTFEIRLIKAWSNAENNPDTINFSNGTFEGEIRQQN